MKVKGNNSPCRVLCYVFRSIWANITWRKAPNGNWEKFKNEDIPSRIMTTHRVSGNRRTDRTDLPLRKNTARRNIPEGLLQSSTKTSSAVTITTRRNFEQPSTERWQKRCLKTASRGSARGGFCGYYADHTGWPIQMMIPVGVDFPRCWNYRPRTT